MKRTSVPKKLARNNDQLYCSFCGASQHEVSRLIAGASVYICDECVTICDDLVLEHLFPGRFIVRVRCPNTNHLDDTLYEVISNLLSDSYPDIDIKYEFKTVNSVAKKLDRSRMAIFSFQKIYGDTPVAEQKYAEITSELASSISKAAVLQEKYLIESEKVRVIEKELVELKAEYLDFLRRKTTQDKYIDELRAVMFVDVKGFSTYNLEEKRRIVGLLRGIVPVFIKERGAQQINMWGDAIVATFCNPDEAIDCAIKFIRHLSVEQLEARIGMAWGKVTIGPNPAIDRLDIHGAVVDLAARIEPLAEPGEILLSKEFDGLELATKNARIVNTTRNVKKDFASYKVGDKIELLKVETVSNF